jgi:hypothetical protein
MKTIQVYDPPMCCSTGICGTDIDPDLVNFAAMLSQLANHGRQDRAPEPRPAADGLRARTRR